MEDRGVYLTIGGGLVLLIVAATAFSSFTQRRASAFEENNELTEMTSEKQATLLSLRQKVEDARIRWAAVSGKTDTTAAMRKAKEEAAARAAKIKGLAERSAELGGSIARVEADFAKYRANYRRNSWMTATGEEVGNLTTLDGRDYRKVTISRVTEEGLEIRHENGVARVPSEQLSGEWHRRFQWKWGETLSQRE